ncbi:MAG: LTA synthase family protein [Candidatus Saccharibacteria bacterium]
MVRIVKNLAKHIIAFISEQYLILFFVLSIGLKLFVINTFILALTWPTNQYLDGIIIGFISTSLIFSPLYFVHKHKNKITIILATLLTILLLIDMVYFSYFKTLPTIGLLSSISEAAGVGPAIAGLLSWWYVLFFIDIIVVILFSKSIRSFFDKYKARFVIEKSGYKTSFVILFITIAGFWFALQPMGGINKLNEVIDRGYDTVSTSQYYGIFLAHAIDITRFIREETTSLSSDQTRTLVTWVNNNKPAQSANDLTGIAKGKNVIMVQVESLGGFVINQSVNGQEITPNLNNLAKNSQFFPNDRFVIGAGHTSDTDFVANTSFFPLTDSAVFVRYGHDDFSSLPKTLAASGYSAYAYHGFNRNFWNRNIALKSLGYQKFYAADNYPKGVAINMGLNDGDFLSKTAEYIKSQPKPSLSYVITLSSHVPFNITDQTKGLNINAQDYPEQVGGYLQDINYTDRMLGEFFAKLKSEGLYDDSLIIVYGDHTPVLSAFTAGTIKYEPTTVQEKEVPLIIKLPSDTTSKTYANQGTHLDITPTILDLLGIKTNQLMFGQSLFAGGTTNLRNCSDQLAVFNGINNCDTTLDTEKNMSSLIVRYNQFNNLK